jgi:hypothetical protein
LNGFWGSDNEGNGISLNGSAAVFPNSDSGNFLSFPSPAGSFSFSSGFVVGVNTLDFYLTNDPFAFGNPEGLRVEFTSATFSTNDVPPPVVTPEPYFFGMLAFGLTCLAYVARQHRANAN